MLTKWYFGIELLPNYVEGYGKSIRAKTQQVGSIDSFIGINPKYVFKLFSIGRFGGITIVT
ncbi:hypothetical protein GCM10008022_28770 [Paenibacillus hunanensis]|nr:hypothetical protein GCM10008022_28770 [Paenibacillus hunanensis]